MPPDGIVPASCSARSQKRRRRRPGMPGDRRDGLSVLGKIQHARRLELARKRKSDRLGNEIDVIVCGEFEDEVELEAYKAHELYQESIRQ
ncbi:Dabb family protein [Bradyrhizobium sp. 184]|uniref:Dabb family protein n=2 Tax=Bradyrhizobium TaxID=374 RepID=UPI00352FFD43